MRSDSQPFDTFNKGRSRTPRYVVQIIYDVSSPSFTSHTGISGVPGTVIESVVGSISSISQEVKPEEGRSTIGSLTVELVEDSSGSITEELRSQLLDNDQGARDRELRVWVGYTDTYSEFIRVATLRVDGVTYQNGKYRISARDLTRALRKKICQPKVTRLTAAIDEDDTTLNVEDTTDFDMIPHGTSFQDAPSATVGYVRIKKTGEIIRYTGKTATSFTGCTRARFNTREAAVAWSGSDSRDRWPEVEEYIYLELPGPLMALALQTGILSTTTPTVVLPDHWHCGLDWSTDFAQGSWTGIGEDLYDASDLTEGFPIRFMGLRDEDGKALIERDVMQLIGCYVSTTVAGRLRLHRVNRVISKNGWLYKFTPSNVVRAGNLEYDFGSLLNSFRVDYEYDGEDYTRSILIIDQPSVDIHGIGEQRVLKFKGLYTARHTERAIKDRLAVLRDRYAEPPLRLTVTLPGKFNDIEIGDTVRVDLPGILDHTMDDAPLDRCFEVQRVQINWITGAVDLKLFASARLQTTAADDDDATPPLATAWYTATGTAINATNFPGKYTAASGGNPARLTGSITHTGHATNVRHADSILYHNGDLTIDAGVTITVNNHLQLRIKGFLQLDGVIDGAGRGPAGATDPDSVGATSTGWSTAGTAGYLGPARAGDGLWVSTFDSGDWDRLINTEGAVVEGRVTAAGPAALETTASGTLKNLPGLLRGSSGGTGGQVTYLGSVGAGTVRAKGGAGGDGGAGVLIVCRGLGFGVNGNINLSGTDGSAGQKGLISAGHVYDLPTDGNPILLDYPAQAGAGAGGFPGALIVVLDGNTVPVPTISSATFIANRGATPINGESAVQVSSVAATYPFLEWSEDLPRRSIDVSPVIWATGRNEHAPGAAENIWAAAHFVQFAPNAPAAQEDVVPPPIWAATPVTKGVGYVKLAWKWPIATEVDYVEVWASTSNDRSFAEEGAQVRASRYNFPLPTGGVRWFWLRARAKDGRTSDWSPTGSTSGQKGVAMDAGTELVLTANRSRIWNGDASTSPTTWVPSQTTLDISCQVKELGDVVATETVRVTRTAAGMLTWAYIKNHADITTTSSATPAQTIDFTFEHTPSGMKAYDTVFATLTGEPGPAGPPGSSVLLGVKANYSDFSTSASGYLYIHGFDENGDPADVDGQILSGSDLITVPKGSIRLSQTNASDGWLGFHPSSDLFTWQGGSVTKYAGVQRKRNGWYYDAAGYAPQGWSLFTSTGVVIIGGYAYSGGTVTEAGVFNAALPRANVPVERAHVVESGDMSVGAIDLASRFASGIQPVEIVASLTTPASSWTGSEVVFCLADRQLYRWNNTVSPIRWDDLAAGDITANTITAGMITAGAIGASALASDIVIATLLRTANTGYRVEIEGGGHAFPLWIGYGTKGTVSGSPGSGARLSYDRAADLLKLSGTLELSRISPDADKPLVLDTTGGQTGSIFGMVRNIAGGTFVQLTSTSVIALAAIFHPDRSVGGDDNAYRRLQHAQQPFLLLIDLTVYPSSGAAPSRDIGVDIEYRFDGSGPYVSISGGVGFSLNTTATNGYPSRWSYNATIAADPGATWGDYIQLRVVALQSGGSAVDSLISGSMVVLIPNAGNTAAPIFLLT